MKKTLISNIILLFLALPFAYAQKKIKVPTEKDMGAYLMVYFKDADHSLHFALSKDGYSFTDVNNGAPVIKGDTIAEQKGIRDPYIYRAPDGTFYLALTDLHIYAQKEGYRTTLWERDVEKYGWGNNRGIVLMKSKDLIHWTHTVLRVDKAFPELADIGCAWAPELIYDEVKKKTMMYFTIHFGKEKCKVYYTYMNKDFTAMETLPKPIFDHPGGTEYIDADITKVGNKYHMMYALHDGGSHVEQAVSDSVNTGYVSIPKRVDAEKVGDEAPTVYKLIGQDKWILVYDIYRINPHNFGFSETTDFVNFTNLGHFNEGVMKATNFSIPKHPGIIQITKKEAQKLATIGK
ncbi:glycoside hydrolase family 43 protein [Mucilaginibacter sp. HMF5004]|uniref:glycoside hydrolase family 43 protein n=1 Tax=Mucilaginibacter rivuli TaxID=2857527 RepID=UPI001C605B70|nr:glycoside hydrolase family 43 protein [Mucilaginibacter rivuli]MBW4888125.1 glycoside hydrolase family 43 protein [Mucilaginibacter rivuli]